MLIEDTETIQAKIDGANLQEASNLWITFRYFHRQSLFSVFNLAIAYSS